MEQTATTDSDVLISLPHGIIKNILKRLPVKSLIRLAMLWDIYGDIGQETPDLIEFWVLDKVTCACRETWNWNKTYTKSPFSCHLDSVTILRNEFVCKHYLRKDSEEERDVLYMMNLTTNEVKWFVIPYRGRAHSFKDYVESLVSVGNN